MLFGAKTISLEEDYSKLESGEDHLNSFEIHVIVVLEGGSTVKFTSGISDYYKNEKRRCDNTVHAYVRASPKVLHKVVNVLENALNQWAHHGFLKNSCFERKKKQTRLHSKAEVLCRRAFSKRILI